MHAQRSTPVCWVAVSQCQPTNTHSRSMSALPALQPPVQTSICSSIINRVPGTAPAMHRTPLSARLMGAGWLITPWSFPNDADHRAGRPPPPDTRASLPDTSAWTVTHNCPISRLHWHQWADKRFGDNMDREPSVVRDKDGRPSRGPSGSALLLCMWCGCTAGRSPWGKQIQGT